MEDRSTLLVLWELDGAPIGFSTSDKIVYGEQAPTCICTSWTHSGAAQAGLGSACVRETVDFYYTALALERLFCEPNAFNVAPNRTLQSVGFRYVKTHMTVPGWLNSHQPVTRWVLEK